MFYRVHCSASVHYVSHGCIMFHVCIVLYEYVMLYMVTLYFDEYIMFHTVHYIICGCIMFHVCTLWFPWGIKFHMGALLCMDALCFTWVDYMSYGYIMFWWVHYVILIHYVVFQHDKLVHCVVYQHDFTWVHYAPMVHCVSHGCIMFHMGALNST